MAGGVGIARFARGDAPSGHDICGSGVVGGLSAGGGGDGGDGRVTRTGRPLCERNRFLDRNRLRSICREIVL